MSWKATAFVKELRTGLSVTEKFVLLILAEYHRTDQKNSWPSVATLASDCLITERATKRILGRLERNLFIVRQVGGGRGNTTAYQFTGLDVPKESKKVDVKGDSESVIPEPLIKERVTVETINSDRNSDPIAHAIRNEPVIERVEPVKTIDSEISGHDWFEKLTEAHPKPEHSQATQVAFMATVEWKVGKEGCSWDSAARYLVARATDYQGQRPYCCGLRKWLVERIFLQDWSRENERSGSGKSAERRDRNREEITAAFERRYSGANAGSGGVGDGIQGSNPTGNKPLVKVAGILSSRTH